MRLAVNGKAFARATKGGAARMAVNLVRWIAEHEPGVNIDVFVPHDPERFTLPDDLPDNVILRRSVSGLYATGVGRSGWEQFVLPKRVRRGGYQVLLDPTNSLPVVIDPVVPQVAVIHDAGFLEPRWFSRTYSTYLTWTLRRAARRGARFATVSRASADQLRAAIPELGSFTVIPNACEDPPPDLEPEVRDHPYVLVLGSLNPRKNLGGAIAGFRRFAAIDTTGTRLLVVGGRKRIFRHSTPPEGPRIELLGYVEDARRWSLLKGARLLLFPSFLEGFGLPVLEALKVETPVVASDTPAFREFFDGAVEFVDPASAADIARGIARVDGDPDRRATLIRTGRQIRERFSAERTARSYLELLRRAAEEAR